MTDPVSEPDIPDQDAEATMTAPPGLRPDGDASVLDPDGRADSPDAVDADDDPADEG